MKLFFSFLDKKIKGGALYIAIIISIVIGIILTFFLLIARYNQRTVTVYTQKAQLYENISNAFELAKSKYFNESINNSWQKNTFCDDSTRIRKIQWGAFTVITAETKNRHERLKQACLFGTFLPADTALVIADNGRPVGLCGKIKFGGNVYFPKAGIKPAFIEGQSYQASAANSSFVKSASASVPEISLDVKQAILALFGKTYMINDSILGNIISPESGSFFAKTIVHELPSTRMKGVKLKDNIKLVCDGDLEIDSTCRLENILIICRKVHFKEGFRGSVHVIASDSIITESKCEFSFPSSFVLGGQTNDVLVKTIEFGSENYFAGGIVAFTENGNSPTKVFVKLNANSEVLGLIYSSNYVDVEGIVNGTIIAQSLLLKTPSAVYENHLLNCELQPHKYANALVVPVLFNKNSKLVPGKAL